MTATGTRRRPPFAMIPEALLYDDRVTPFAVRLYGALDRWLGPAEVGWPGYDTLRELLAYVEPSTGRRRVPSDEALGNAVACLEASGWLDVERSRGSSNRYRLLDRPRPQAGQNPGDGQPSTTRARAATSTRASAGQPPAPGRRDRETRENNPPNPPQSGGTDASHDGRHPNCRACGTGRRGPKPPDPEQAAAEVRRRAMEASTAEHAAALAQARAESTPPPAGIRDALRPPKSTHPEGVPA